MYAFDITDVIILILLIILIFSFLGINIWINNILSYIEYIFGTVINKTTVFITTTVKTGTDIIGGITTNIGSSGCSCSPSFTKKEMDLEFLSKINEHNNKLDKSLLQTPMSSNLTDSIPNSLYYGF